MHSAISRRWALKHVAATTGGCCLLGRTPNAARAGSYDSRWESSIRGGLDWVARTQSRLGHWTAANCLIHIASWDEEVRDRVDLFVTSGGERGFMRCMI